MYESIFQEPKSEVLTISIKAYAREDPSKIWPYMALYGTVPSF